MNQAPTKSVLEIAPRYIGAPLRLARALSVLPAAQYDAVYCPHIVHHFDAVDLPAVLAGIRHVLKPDGFAEFRGPDHGLADEPLTRALAPFFRIIQTETQGDDLRVLAFVSEPTLALLETLTGHSPRVIA